MCSSRGRRPFAERTDRHTRRQGKHETYQLIHLPVGDPFRLNLSQPDFYLNTHQSTQPFDEQIAYLTRLRRD
ncbi:MAG: hypothetical protein LBT09_03825 [Planctomycetaceae bacterium]|nr:hypothetical protein [Planctomycetaceae bacterium]